MRRFLAWFATTAVVAATLLAAAPAAAIVNGKTANVNAGVVSIWTDNPHRNRCGGALASPDRIILAAHCYYALTAPDAGRVEVRIGAIDNTVPCTPSTPEWADCYISRTIIDYDAHPGFNPDLYGTRDDVMVGVLDSAVPSSKARPMKWRTTPLEVGTQFRVQGYGWVCDGPPGLDCSTWYKGPLQEANFRAVDTSSCPEMDQPPANQVCFKHAQNDYVSACPGDSGTGGFTKALDVNILRVIVIGDGDDVTGRSCTTAPDGSPGAGYGIDVGRYQPWLMSVMVETNVPSLSDGSPRTLVDVPSPPPVSPPTLARMYALAG